MDGIFTYIWVIYGVNVGKYSIHGASVVFVRIIFVSAGLREAACAIRFQPIGWCTLAAARCGLRLVIEDPGAARVAKGLAFLHGVFL